MLKSLTGPKVLVFEDQGFLTLFACIPKLDVNKNVSG